MSLPEKPETRREQYLSVMAGQGTAADLPESPKTREEEYLDYIARYGGGGGGGDVTKAYVDMQDAKKVDKEDGKALSSNDFTNSYKIKLNGIEASAEVNVISAITLNGVALVPSNKTVAINVITNAVNDLVNYYTKSQTYTKTEVDDLISAVTSLTLDIVEELPVSDISTTTIYLVPVSGVSNVYMQYAYINNDWAQLGTTEVDLSNYYTKTQVDTLLAAKQNTLTFDDAPTSASNNPVKSGGIYNALNSKQDTLTFDNTPTTGSTNMVKSGAIADAISAVAVSVATVETTGKVKPDGTTVTIDLDGTIHASGGGTGDVTKAYVDAQDATKTDKVISAVTGNFAGLDENGNLTDSGKKATDFATATDMSDVKGVIPSTATTSNKLATASDVADEEISATATNTSFSLSDATDGRIQGLAIEGRSTNNNLLEVKHATEAINGITFTNNGDGTFKLNGTASDTVRYRIDQLSLTGNPKKYESGTYTASGASTKFKLFVMQFETWTTIFTTNFEAQKTASVTGTSDCFTCIEILEGTSFNNETFRIMFNKGETALPFEPYGINNVGDNGLSVTSCGKNILKATHPDIVNRETKTENGVTFTIYKNDDGNLEKVVVNGTASAQTGVVISDAVTGLKETMKRYVGKTVTCSGCPTNGSLTTYSILMQGFERDSIGVHDTGNGATAVVADSTNFSNAYQIMIMIRSGCIANNLVFRPQLELGSAATAFEPYTGSTASLTTGLPLCSVGSIKDEVDYNRGVVIKRTAKIVLNGTETGWGVNSQSPTSSTGSKWIQLITNAFRRPKSVGSDETSHAISADVDIVSPSECYGGEMDDCLSIRDTLSGGTLKAQIGIRIAGIATVSDLTAYLASNPVTVVYELAEPYEIPMTAAEVTAYHALRTFENTTNITATDSPTMTVDYLLDTENGKAVGKVVDDTTRQMLNLLSLIAAPYDDTATYALGAYCTENNMLYKCTTAVSLAEPFDPEKWTATTIMAEI